MTTTILILCLFFIPGVLITGWIGVEVAGRFGRDRRMGFVLGSIGSVGGWMVAAIRPARQPRDDTPSLALHRVYAATGVLLACLHAAYLAHLVLAVVMPHRFGRVLTATFASQTPGLAWSIVGWTIWGALLLLWALSWTVLIRDRELPRGARWRWMVGLALLLGALVYAPSRQRRVSAVRAKR